MEVRVSLEEAEVSKKAGGLMWTDLPPPPPIFDGPKLEPSHPIGREVRDPFVDEQNVMQTDPIGREVRDLFTDEQGSGHSFPIVPEVRDLLADQWNVRHTDPIGREFGDPLADQWNVRHTNPIGQEVEDPLVYEQDTGQISPIGRGVGDPLVNQWNVRYTDPIGRDIGDQLVDEQNVGNTIPIGRDVGDPMTDQWNRRHNYLIGRDVGEPLADQWSLRHTDPIGQDVSDPLADKLDTGQASSIGQDVRDQIADQCNVRYTDPIGQEVGDPFVDEQNVGNTDPIGREIGDPLMDEQNIGNTVPIGRDVRDPLADEQDTRQASPIGRDFGDPLVDEQHTRQASPIGRDFGDPLADEQHTRQASPIGRDVGDPLVDEQDAGQASPIGQDVGGPLADEQKVRHTDPIGQVVGDPLADQWNLRHTDPIGKGARDPLADQWNLKYTSPIGREPGDPIADEQDAGQASPISQVFGGDPLMDKLSVRQTNPIGREVGDPVEDEWNLRHTGPFGQEVGDPFADDQDVEQASPIGCDVEDPLVDEQDTGQAFPIGQEVRDPFADEQDAGQASPIGCEVEDPLVVQQDTGQASPIGQEVRDPFADEQDAGQASSVGREVRDPFVDEQDAGQASPIGQEVRDPFTDEQDAGQASAIGRDFGEPLVDEQDAGQASSVGREVRDPFADEQDAGQASPIGQEVRDPFTDEQDAGQASAIGRDFGEPLVEEWNMRQTDLIGRDLRDALADEQNVEHTVPIGQVVGDPLADQWNLRHTNPIGQEFRDTLVDEQNMRTTVPIGQEVRDPLADKVQVYFVLGVFSPGRFQESDLTPSTGLPEHVAPQEMQPPLERRVEDCAPEVMEEQPHSDRLWQEESFRRRSRSAPPAGSPEPSAEGPVSIHSRRSNGGTTRCQLQRQDAISTEAEMRGWEEGEEVEQAGEDEESMTRGDGGRRPLSKTSSCPSPGSEPDPGLWQAAAASRVEKQPSREWHRRGIRRPSMATQSSQGGSMDQPEDLQSEDLLNPGNANHLEARLSRRRSKILQSSRLLYQEYSHVALDQEILRQKREVTPSGEAPGTPELVQRRPRDPACPRAPSMVRASLFVPFCLWRDIPEVRSRHSELDRLTQGQLRLQEAKFELITSEASCLRSLDIAVEHFQLSSKLQALLGGQERQWLFSKLADVREVSRRFLADLEEDLEQDIMEFDVCGIFLSHLPDFRAVYIPYVTNQSYQEKTFKRLIRDNPQFREVVEELESDPLCQRLSLKSFLILPFQRITRLKLLVQNILKRSSPGSHEECKASKAFESLAELMSECNENVRRLKSTEALITLNQKIDFESKIFPLVSQSRRLVKDGQLTEIEAAISSLTKRRPTSRTIYLHLFNDCILLSRKKENGRFSVFDHTHSRNLIVENRRVRGHRSARFVFQLTLMQNHRGILREFLLKAHTQTEKQRWISALTPIKQEIDLIQHYDSKQVQCLKPYKAAEHDELTLEKADILIVIQGGWDGWEEGYRLSDGERGWFPSDHVDPIRGTNARIRNIEERLRVRRMADQLQASAVPP